MFQVTTSPQYQPEQLRTCTLAREYKTTHGHLTPLYKVQQRGLKSGETEHHIKTQLGRGKFQMEGPATLNE